MGIRLVDVARPDATRIGWRALAIRYGLLVGIFAAPLLLLFFVGALGSGGDLMAELHPVLLFAATVWTIWWVWNVVLVVRRRPAVYDQAAGLEVVRTMRSVVSPTAPDIVGSPA